MVGSVQQAPAARAKVAMEGRREMGLRFSKSSLMKQVTS